MSHTISSTSTSSGVRVFFRSPGPTSCGPLESLGPTCHLHVQRSEVAPPPLHPSPLSSLWSLPPPTTCQKRQTPRRFRAPAISSSRTASERTEICMSSMAWHLLPESGTILSATDELFEDQSADQGVYWTLWDSSLSDDMNTSSMYSDNQGSDRGAQSFDTAEHCSTRPSNSEEQPGYPSPFEPHHTEQTNDMFMSQFSNEEVRRMDAPFQALDMFPDSMHRLLSYEHMLSGVLMSGSQSQEADMDQDDMDTCGFPLYFSHGGLQDDDQVKKVNGGLPPCAKLLEPTSREMVDADTSAMDKAGVNTLERSCPIATAADEGSSEAAVLEELEEVVFQMAKKTRICLRDAFYRLAESSRARAPCSAAANIVVEPRGHGSRRRCAEREANAIDRTVVNLAFRPPCSAAQELHGSEAEAMSA
ncbi:hypothetical protein ABZP36_014635 [Zizania latifolia]